MNGILSREPNERKCVSNQEERKTLTSVLRDVLNNRLQVYFTLLIYFCFKEKVDGLIGEG